MAEIWVVNASPLIALAKVGHVDLLATPGRSVIVPEAVAEEILRGHAYDPARRALEAGLGADVRRAAHDPEVVEWSLGAGESAVLSLSRALGALAILDDREARVAARTLGVRFSGTLGIVVQAARAGRIGSAVPLIRAATFCWPVPQRPRGCRRPSPAPWRELGTLTCTRSTTTWRSSLLSA
ncbi:MAG: DUF3368 domain-containing protein [Pseudomonadota bacterium]|nr:DUF3368 domain-containing protein [Pseudomonadota bacterium]